jgi:hypothetical protein
VRHHLSIERGFGRLLDFGMIAPRLQQLYEWSAHDPAGPAATPGRCRSFIDAQRLTRTYSRTPPAGLGVLVDAFVVRLTLVPAAMAIIGERVWYHPRWYARRIPDPDIEGEKLERQPAAATAAEPAST